MKILYFTDAHDTPDTHKKRFTALGNLIVKEQPDVIVQGGDFLTLDSLSAWDSHKARLREGKRYAEEIESGNLAISELFAPLHQWQDRQRSAHKAIYKPHVIWMEGNHEGWVSSYLDRFPEAEGLLELSKLQKFPEEAISSLQVVPYKKTINIGGVSFAHAIIGRTGPISSIYLCKRALAEVYSSSVVFGHTHVFQFHETERFNPDGVKQKHMALNGGCFFEKDPRYSKGNTNNYWQGCFILHTSNISEGAFDFTTVSMERLYDEYYHRR